MSLMTTLGIQPYVSGMPGWVGMSFDGDDYFQRAIASDFQIASTDVFAVEYWVYADAGGGDGSVLTISPDAGYAPGLTTYVNATSGTLTMRMHEVGGAWGNYTKAGALSAATWTHCLWLVSIPAKTGQLWINGVAQNPGYAGTKPTTNLYDGTTTAVRAGKWYQVDNYLAGRIALLRYYKGASIDPAAILAARYDPWNTSLVDLKASWVMLTGTGGAYWHDGVGDHDLLRGNNVTPNSNWPTALNFTGITTGGPV